MDANALESMARQSIYRMLAAVADQSPAIVTHVAIVGTDPDGLEIHLAYRDREQRLAARASGHSERVRQLLLAALTELGYPSDRPTVSFVSVEEVDAQGGPSMYFK